jgi:uncharacterized glyoxalase superfamily protein PhnB
MTDIKAPARATVIPTLRYRDGHAAIAWLCQAFGFEKRLVITDASGDVAHAELVHGNGMIMLGAAANNAFHELVQSPSESGAIGSQSAYIVVADPDAHYRRAVAAGAAIVVDLEDEDYGRGYSCRDPEGHVWNFGTYDPWAATPAAAGAASATR